MKNALTLKTYMDDLFSDLVFDEVLAKKIYEFQVRFVSKDLEHINFFGGNLLGVNVIMFKDSDVEEFLEDVLDIDPSYLYSTIKKVDTIVHEFKVAGNPFNLVLIYIAHRWLTLPKSKKAIARRAVTDTLLIFFYRCFCALNNAYFRYPVSENLAKTVYEKLSGKYLIRKLGTWGKVCEYRVEQALDKNKKQLNYLIEFTDDYQLQQLISAYQGSIRSMYKNFYDEMLKVKLTDEIMQSKSGSVIDIEGKETLGDVVDNGEIMISRAKALLGNRDSFLKPEIIAIISSVNKNTNTNHLEKSLEWLQSNYMDHKYYKTINEYLELAIVYSLNTINNVIGKNRIGDLPYVIVRLKNVLSASKVSDGDLKRIRKLGEEFVKNAVGSKGSLIISSTSTAMVLYIVILVLSRNDK
jgi:hypothetical protein